METITPTLTKGIQNILSLFSRATQNTQVRGSYRSTSAQVTLKSNDSRTTKYQVGDIAKQIEKSKIIRETEKTLAEDSSIEAAKEWIKKRTLKHNEITNHEKKTPTNQDSKHKTEGDIKTENRHTDDKNTTAGPHDEPNESTENKELDKTKANNQNTKTIIISNKHARNYV